MKPRTRIMPGLCKVLNLRGPGHSCGENLGGEGAVPGQAREEDATQLDSIPEFSARRCAENDSFNVRLLLHRLVLMHLNSLISVTRPRIRGPNGCPRVGSKVYQLLEKVWDLSLVTMAHTSQQDQQPL